MHVSLPNFIDNVCYSCLYKKKFFKIKTNEIHLKIDYITRKLSELVILSIEKEMLA